MLMFLWWWWCTDRKIRVWWWWYFDVLIIMMFWWWCCFHDVLIKRSKHDDDVLIERSEYDDDDVLIRISWWWCCSRIEVWLWCWSWCYRSGCWLKEQNAEEVVADRKIKVLKMLLIERLKCWRCCWSKGQSVEDVADQKVKICWCWSKSCCRWKL